MFDRKMPQAVAVVAPIAEESLAGKKPIFSWQKRVTNGNSFFGLEKKVFDKSLDRKAGIASEKDCRL